MPDKNKGHREGITDVVSLQLQIVAEASKAFGDGAKASRWLHKPNRVFGGKRPIDLAGTEAGAVLVRRALAAIEYGVIV